MPDIITTSLPTAELIALRADKTRLDFLAARSYREGGPGKYALVYAVVSFEVWPIAGHALDEAEKRAALRNAIDEAAGKG